MDVHQLKVFMAVYKNRSFSRAAEELGLSQPTVSEHIMSLEEELGKRLFDRLGRSIIPTSEADILFPRAEEVVEEIERIPSYLEADRSKISGTIVIGASTIPGTYLMPPLIKAFVGKYPDVSFRVIIGDSSEITDMILRHDLTCGIVGSKRNGDDRLMYKPFREDEIILVAGSEMSLGKEIRIDELTGIPFVIREEGSGTRKTIEDALRNVGVDPGNLMVVAMFGSTDAVKESLLQGLGVSFLSRLSVKEELRRGSLREIRVKGLKIRRRFYFLSHSKRTLPIQTERFMRFAVGKGG